MTRIAVVTPSFAYGRFIADAIDSVGYQKFPTPSTHIIQDGGSTDETEAIVHSRSSAFPISFVREADGGQSDALNKAIPRIADADVVGWLNADEFYLRGAFQRLAMAVTANPNAVVYFGDCLFVNERGELIRSVPAHRMSRFVLRNYGNFISSCTTFVKREVLSEVGWDVTLRQTMDWDLWLTLADMGPFHYIPAPMAAFRVHSAQITPVGAHGDAAEEAALFHKHRIRTNLPTAFAAKAAHAALKLADGAYRRQLRERSRVGEPMQWWGQDSQVEYGA